MDTNKPINEWENILLDTSIICSLFTSENNDVTDEVILFVKEFIRYLTHNKSNKGNERHFYISTITISELLTSENDLEKIKRIIAVIDSSNVNFIDFDLNTSLIFNRDLHPILSKKKLNELADNYGFKSHNYLMAREWIIRDLMIIESGKSQDVDVILTTDKKTFYPLCEKANACCILTYPEYFRTTRQNSQANMFNSTPLPEFQYTYLYEEARTKNTINTAHYRHSQT